MLLSIYTAKAITQCFGSNRILHMRKEMMRIKFIGQSTRLIAQEEKVVERRRNLLAQSLD